MKRFTDKQKQEIIDYSNTHGLSGAKKKYGVWPETIRYWTREDVRASHNSKSKNAYHTRYKYDESYKQKKKEYYNRTKRDYLDYSYTDKQCKRELENLKNTTPSYSAYPTRNRIIHTFQPHFFDKERKLWRNEYIRSKLIENRTKYLNKTEFSDREILRGFKISGIHIGYSHFSPMWFAKFVKDNNIKTVYDPCGGWGHRMVGACISDVNYIYNDKWVKTYDGCNNIKHFLNFPCVTYNEDCTKFTPNEDYECIFTCPPYDNTEIYNDETIEDYDKFLIDMFSCSIKDSTTDIAIVINKPYIDNVVRACPFKLKEIYTLGTTHQKSHFNIDSSHKGEYLLHFTKYIYEI